MWHMSDFEALVFIGDALRYELISAKSPPSTRAMAPAPTEQPTRLTYVKARPPAWVDRLVRFARSVNRGKNWRWKVARTRRTGRLCVISAREVMGSGASRPSASLPCGKCLQLPIGRAFNNEIY
jgi:hypothetical protein